MKSLKALYIAQFLSAFVDNMLLFIAQAIIVKGSYPAYYLPLVQGTFLFSYILLSPWVGRYADKHAKSIVLIHGNLIKGLGVILFFLECDPALSYAVAGGGAAVYGPAKYGALPLLTSTDKELLSANSCIESFTILAILAGSVTGGFLSDYSITFALTIALSLYGTSILVNLLIKKDQGDSSINYQNSIRSFTSDVTSLVQNQQSFFSLIGTGSFWFASAVLRIVVFSWVPLVLGITSNTEISLIFVATGIGLVLGAIVTPFLITLQTYRRTLIAGMAIAIIILCFPAIHSLPLIVMALLFIGIAGGFYVIPLNALLQHVGHRSVGAGKTIAVQNFTENLFMFLGIAAYTIAVKVDIDINISIFTIGAILIVILSYMYSLRKNDKGTGEAI